MNFLPNLCYCKIPRFHAPNTEHTTNEAYVMLFCLNNINCTVQLQVNIRTLERQHQDYLRHSLSFIQTQALKKENVFFAI